MPLTLPSSARRRFERLAGDVRRVFEDRFVALVATSLSRSVMFAATITPGDLDALGSLVHAWHREELDTPLLMTPDEFRRSLDAFPLEYQAIIDRHAVIAGTPPFEGVAVALDQLRRACEVQAKGHIIHLRQGWLEAAGHADKLAALVAQSAPPLRTLLTNVARLAGVAERPDKDLALSGADVAGLPADLIRTILELEDAPERRHAAVAQMRDYLFASERLWAFVDGWRA